MTADTDKISHCFLISLSKDDELFTNICNTLDMKEEEQKDFKRYISSGWADDDVAVLKGPSPSDEAWKSFGKRIADFGTGHIPPI